MTLRRLPHDEDLSMANCRRRHGRPNAMLLAAVIALQGCATLQKYFEVDASYPSGWNELVPARAECNSVQGTYANEGLIRDADGTTRPVTLTSLLGLPGAAKVVSVAVRTRHVDLQGIAYNTLRVLADGAADGREFKDCYCIRQVLQCRNVSRSGGIFGIGQRETNIGFYNSKDGSLVGKLETDRGITDFSKKIPWVRFATAGR
jgi:hypothetical protein